MKDCKHCGHETLHHLIELDPESQRELLYLALNGLQHVAEESMVESDDFTPLLLLYNEGLRPYIRCLEERTGESLEPVGPRPPEEARA